MMIDSLIINQQRSRLKAGTTNLIWYVVVFVGGGRDGGNLQFLISHREWQLLHNGSAFYPGSSDYIETACEGRVTSLINVLIAEHVRSPLRTTRYLSNVYADQKVRFLLSILATSISSLVS
jgi:hypothetical protein